MSAKQDNGRSGAAKSRVVIFVIVPVIVCLLVIMFWPVYQRLPEWKEVVQCKSNLRQIGLSMFIYAQENDGRYPDPNRWCDSVIQYMKDPDELFVCPGGTDAPSHYAMNPNAEPNGPSDLVLLFDTKGGWNQYGGPEMLTFENHRGKYCNIVFSDYHVGMVEPDEVGRLKWENWDFRRPANDSDLRYWLDNMVCYHRFSNEEITAATGFSEREIEAKRRFDIRPGNRPERSANAPVLVLPYPGGRHPRIGFLEGAIDPQRETKFSVFTPWDANSYVVVDVPEAIWSNLGLTFLAHTHIDTIWSKQGIELEKLEWNRHPHPDGRLEIERTLPNGIGFGVKVEPTKDAVLMEMWLLNGTEEKLTDLRIQNCVMTKMAEGFEQQTNENKVMTNPYVACKSSDGKRWIITAWEGCHNPWANDKCPCFHSDPKFPDLEPGRKETLKGWLSFYEGEDIETEFKRIEATDWRKN